MACKGSGVRIPSAPPSMNFRRRRGAVGSGGVVRGMAYKGSGVRIPSAPPSMNFRRRRGAVGSGGVVRGMACKGSGVRIPSAPPSMNFRRRRGAVGSGGVVRGMAYKGSGVRIPSAPQTDRMPDTPRRFPPHLRLTGTEASRTTVSLGARSTHRVSVPRTTSPRLDVGRPQGTTWVPALPATTAATSSSEPMAARLPVALTKRHTASTLGPIEPDGNAMAPRS